LRAEEIAPVEVIIVGIERFGGISCCVVAFASALVGEDGVGEGDFLEFGVGGVFGVWRGLVCGLELALGACC